MKQNEIRKVLESETTKTAKMLTLYAEGLGIKEIADLMNVRYNFVYNVVSNDHLKQGKRLSLSGSKESKKAQIIALLEAGKSNVEIAAELKCSYNYVFNTAKEHFSKQQVK